MRGSSSFKGDEFQVQKSSVRKREAANADSWHDSEARVVARTGAPRCVQAHASQNFSADYYVHVTVILPPHPQMLSAQLLAKET